MNEPHLDVLQYRTGVKEAILQSLARLKSLMNSGEILSIGVSILYRAMACEVGVKLTDIEVASADAIFADAMQERRLLSLH
ncbi:MAG: hypothetical protein WBD81_10985 [Collimonas pratensis]|uniref:hypothetical protein n=1 Tax=Collimonas pratensis TaxID=279113 RepID=UPI003C787CD3